MNQRSSRFFAVTIFLFLLFSLQPARASTWNHVQVDNAATVGKSLSAAVDPAGKLYIGYLDTTSTAFMKYANNAAYPFGDARSIENLTNILPYAMNSGTATVLTPGGPRIMAYTYNSSLGKYMYRAARKVTGDGWQVQDIAGGISPLDGSLQPAMGTVSTSTQTGSTQYMGFTYITYNDGSKLWYANERDMAWYNITTTASTSVPGSGGLQSDLGIDSIGNVHVAYVDALNNLYYAKNPIASTSARTKIYDNTYSISTPSVAIDSHDNIHVVFAVIRSVSNQSKVYHLMGTPQPDGSISWPTTPTEIGQAGKYGGYTTFKIDSADNLHVAWYASDSDSLRYNQKLASGGWVYPYPGDEITYSGSSSNYGQYAAMAIDQYNNVNIAYYDVTNSSIDVVTKPNPAIDVSPSPLLFGYVPQYETSVPQTVTIANKGNANLIINSIGNPTQADFEVVSNGCAPLPRTLAAGATCTVSYQFDPDITGAQTATVSIGSTDPNFPTKTVTMKGTATVTANHTIVAGTMGPGGTISPAGASSVPDGTSQTFTITPDPGYLVGMVMIDPVFADPENPTMQEMGAASKGALTSYTFNEVTTDHSILVMFMPYVAVSAWSTTEIDNASYTGRNCSIAIDPDNNLHIGYLQSAVSTFTSPLLKYATNAGGSWVATSLQYILPNAMNASTSTVYTPGGPRIMAYSFDSATLEYKYQAARKILGDGWQLQDIGGGINPLTGQPEEPMTAVSAATQTGALQYMGFTFITFNNGNYLQYANEKDMAWYKITDAGTAAGNGGIQSDLTIDSSGNIHAVYVDALNNLMYRKNPTSPTVPVVPILLRDSTGNISNPNIVIDANNALHVIYLDATDGNKAMYIKSITGGATWSTPRIIGATGGYGGYLGIKADNTGGIHISYYYSTSTSSGLLMYQQILPSGSWGSEEIIKDPNSSANYGQYAVMAIDNNNMVNIAYYDATRSSLKVTRMQAFGINVSPSPLYFGNVANGSTATNTVTVTNKGTSGNLKIMGSPTFSGANASEFEIDSNTCTDGLTIAPGAAGCEVTVRFTPNSTSGAKTANLVIGSNDLLIPHKSVLLSGTSNAPASYTITAGVAGVGGNISPAGPVTVAGSDNQTFTITPDPGYLVAFVSIDPQGMTQQDLMAASQGALSSYTFNQVTANHSIFVVFMPAIPVTSWKIDQVDNTGTTGKYCSITNDPAGKLHVGYLEGTSTLKYATNKGGSWAYETVSVIPSITAAGTATVFSEGIGPRVMAYSYDTTTLARKYGAARKWTEQAPQGGNLNDWQLQWIAGDYYPPEYGGGPQPAIANTTTDTFTGATQVFDPVSGNSFTFITFTDGNNLWYANEKDFYYLKLDPTHSVAGAGKQSDLALDSDANIHMIYYTPGASGTGELRYGFGQGGYTDPVNNPPVYSETILLTGITSDPSITIDGLNQLHVSYIQSGRVYYKNKPYGGAWSAAKDIGPCGTNGAYTSIKANGLNIVHLTYYSYNSTNAQGKLMYVTRSADGLWSAPQAVTDTVANFGQYAALTVDMHHNVNIAYYDVTNSSLKVAARMIPVISGPSSVNFGSVAPSALAHQTINISNLGQDNLRIGTVTKDGLDASNFSILANTCDNTTILPGGTGCSITVEFSASTPAAYTATLHITSNDRYTPDQQVALTATVTGATLYAITTSVNASAGTHVMISPGGIFNVPSDESQNFLFFVEPGFFVTDVKVDGVTNTQAISDGHYAFENVTANHTLDVTFESYVKAGTNFIGTLQAALWEAATYDVPIKARAFSFTEYLVYGEPTLIILGGGYDSAFTAQTGVTIIKGTLEISDGGIEAQNIGVEPPPGL